MRLRKTLLLCLALGVAGPVVAKPTTPTTQSPSGGQPNGQGNGQANGQGNGQSNGQSNGQGNGQGNGQPGGPTTLASDQGSASSACDRILDVNPAAVACVGYQNGNDDLAEVIALASGAQWTDLGTLARFKDDNAGPGTTSSLFDSNRNLPADSDDSTGTLTFLQQITGSFILTLKGGNDFAAYLFTGGALIGSTITFDIPGVQAMGFSHGSIYVDPLRLSVPPPPRSPEIRVANGGTVPEPGPLALLALAAAAWALSRRVTRRA